MIKNTSCLAFAIALTACVSAPDPVDNPDKSSPTAKDDSFAVATFERMPEGKEINILANDDFGLDGALSWSVVIEPSLGKLAINDQGTDKVTDDTLQYIPLEGMTGADSFTYKIVDGGGRSEAEATVNITISKLTNVTLSFTEAGKVQVDFGLNATVADSYFTLLVKADGQSEYVEVVGAEKIATDGNDFELDNLLTNYDLASGSYMLELHSSDESLIDSKELELKVLDADGDNVDDFHDAFPMDKTESADSDGDGVGDNSDVFPDDATEAKDTDGDKIGDNADNDIDGDGFANEQDDLPYNATEYKDTDGDGIGDNSDSDRDGDGVENTKDAFPNDATESYDNDKPTATDDSYKITLSSNNEITKELDVLANDDFGNDGARALSIVTLPKQGTVKVNNHNTESTLDDTFVYTPDIDALGEDSFRYQITDNGGGSVSIATVHINIYQLKNAQLTTGANPGYVNISWSAAADDTGYLSLLVNPDGKSGYSSVTGAEHIALSETSIEVKADLLRYNFANGSYLLELRNSADKVLDSKVLTFSDLSTADLIGYFKASSNIDKRDFFGNSIALSSDGNIMAVGAYMEDSIVDNSGAVYVFKRDENGHWTQVAYLKARDPKGDSFFGKSVSISSDGSVIAIGAHGLLDAIGTAYIFSLTAVDTWTQEAKLIGDNTLAGDGFGTSVSLNSAGNILAVGAERHDQQDGAVYVFNKNKGNTWDQQAYITSPLSRSPHFGSAVDLNAEGDILAVAAYNAGFVTRRKKFERAVGAVSIYSADDTGQWISHSQTAFTGDEAGLYDNFGFSISLNDVGDLLAVGTRNYAVTPSDDPTSAEDVYVFARHSSGYWYQRDHLKASNTGAGALFGSSVSLSGDGSLLAVGASYEGCNLVGGLGLEPLNCDKSFFTGLHTGAVYLFSYQDRSWQQKSYIKASQPDSGDDFGRFVALSSDGSTLAVEAMCESSSATGIGGDQSDNSIVCSGAVYLY
jgi:hypothetical protein